MKAGNKMIDNLIKKIKETENPTVFGLDPKLEYVPEDIINKSFKKYGETLEGASDAIFNFNRILIDSLYDIVPAVKPQSAYYEMYGIDGLICLKKTIEYAKKAGLYVILDGKRGDIGATSEAYANAYLGKTKLLNNSVSVSGCDSLTVNPYLGSDGVLPFVSTAKENNKSVFVLVKTSNPSSGELQDLYSDGKHIYEHMASLVSDWSCDTYGKYGYSNAIGVVVGATYPSQAQEIRKILKHNYFLVPGYGAQGGKAEDIAKSFNDDGLGVIVNASRSIMCAYKKQGGTLSGAAREEAIRMRDDIMSAL